MHKRGTDPGFGVFVATAPAMADSTLGGTGGGTRSPVLGRWKAPVSRISVARGNYLLLLAFFESCIKIEENEIKCV